nr:MAG TPA: Pyrrolidone-carboxylate peptidase [Crassvirales sp.]
MKEYYLCQYLYYSLTVRFISHPQTPPGGSFHSAKGGGML